MGDTVNATPYEGDFEHEFQGRVIDFRKGLIQVEDQDANVFECFPHQLKHSETGDE